MADDMKIKTVAVLGAGAVGSYIVWGLANKKDVCKENFFERKDI